MTYEPTDLISLEETKNNQNLALPQRIFTFDEILEIGDYVICDSSIKSSFVNKNWYEDKVYTAHRFSEFDSSSTEKEIELANDFIRFLSKQKVLTTSGVSQEILKMVSLLEDKIHYLSKRKRIPC